ncbi:MAG TPA: alpha/beta fold hydrolase [Ohtaekwangia sp.]|nr:alpha/beta fold hydrolase [Ohtaekwangia sp.]
MKRRKYSRLLYAFLALFVMMNVVAYMHAYKFTHFTTEAVPRTKDPKALSVLNKLKVLATGVDNPKPKHTRLPLQPFNTIIVNSTKRLECWSIQVPGAKGTVILFHGYSGEKSSLLTRADKFLAQGYNTFLVDFTGSGGSEGSTTSVGYHEGIEVRDCFEYVRQTGEQNIFLFGTSMGAAAILKAIDDYSIAPQAIIMECPFGSLYTTVCNRFRLMGVPTFPMAGLLAFWGGAQNGYWAFSHNPKAYAASVTCPALLLFGEQDNRVSREETDAIYAALKGTKVLKTYPEEGHDIFTTRNQDEWASDVSAFLRTLPQP